MIRRLCLLVSLLLVPALAQAQSHVTETFISFETDCAGNPTPGTPNLLGYKVVDSSLYAPCGLISATSGGTFGQQQLLNPPLDPGIGAIAGMDGSWAFAGAFTLDALNITFGPVELVFMPAVNELAFDALELGNATGLTIQLLAGDGSQILQQNPTADGQQIVRFSHTSTTPIAKVVLTYVPAVLDGWFIDSLRFNVWSCGDGEQETGEACDSPNGVQCDGCGNDCSVTTNGCLIGASCVADGTSEPGSDGCSVCDVSQRVAGSDVGYSVADAGTSCDDGQFCTVSEVCDGAGLCSGSARECGDAFACTIDTCDEAMDACTTAVGSGCLMDGACHATGDRNPEAPCESCDPARNPSGWTTLEGGEACGAPSCMAGSLTPAPLCGPGGECIEQEPVDCDGAVCADPISCVDGCTEDDDCLEENHCEAGACVPDEMQGDDCQRDEECSTGHCADGVCCDAACSGTCQACDAEDTRGMCTDVPVGTDPDAECEGAGVCSAENTCVTYETRGNGLCALPAAPEAESGVLLGLLGLALVLARRRTRR